LSLSMASQKELTSIFVVYILLLSERYNIFTPYLFLGSKPRCLLIQPGLWKVGEASHIGSRDKGKIAGFRRPNTTLLALQEKA
jgi:hypothetical protein